MTTHPPAGPVTGSPPAGPKAPRLVTFAISALLAACLFVALVLPDLIHP